MKMTCDSQIWDAKKKKPLEILVYVFKAYLIGSVEKKVYLGKHFW